ncbi:MAG: hypothetical protein V3W45_07760 [Sedimentisphaerales bacterium]
MSSKAKKTARLITGWGAVILITVVACFWALWGTIENFHEGWYYPSLLKNLALMLVQYLGFSLITITIGIIAIRWPKIGGAIIITFSFLLSWLVLKINPLSQTNLRAMLSWFPLIGLPWVIAVLFLFGQPQPRKWAYITVAGLPLLTMLICAVEPIYRISGRIDDGIREERLVEGNGVKLLWAPAGPGWAISVGQSCSWEEACRRCRFLTKDGKTLAETPQNIWRLPTVDEAVRSMARHGRNSGGNWDPEKQQATYEIRPDKESPLWDTTSGIIYWWTASEVDEEHSFIIVYHGGVYPRKKQLRMGSLGFRAVKAVQE